ncbi:MAG: EamA family transporter [Gilvibacter sp.]
MMYLILSIVSSTGILIVFKLFKRFNIDRLQAIVVNYIVACLCGFIAFDGPLSIQQISQADWFLPTAALGALFILIFYLMALTTQRAGLSVTSVAVKMSLVIPILFGLLFYKESANALKVIGIVLALVAVYLTSSRKEEGKQVTGASVLVLPLLVFLGSGIIDTSIKFLEDSYVGEGEVPLFSSTVFGAAASLGILFLIVGKLRGKVTFAWRNILGGIALGIPNYFSIYFLVQALRIPSLESSTVFTINNVAIVLFSTLVGISLFKEKLSPKNWFGILLAVVSIVLVAIAI